MKKFMAASLLLLSLAGCDVRRHDKAATNDALHQQVELKDPTTVQIIDSSYNFGKITEGDVVEFSFRFKNTGNKPLIITNASATCGCTIPEKPEEPVKPGETGYLKVKFNSANKRGTVHKEVTVSSNADPAFPELVLTGEVLEKKDN